MEEGEKRKREEEHEKRVRGRGGKKRRMGRGEGRRREKEGGGRKGGGKAGFNGEAAKPRQSPGERWEESAGALLAACSSQERTKG